MQLETGIAISHLHDWRASPDLHGARPGKLTHGGLHVVERFTHEDEQDDVGHEEGAAAILIRQVGETPHVADSDLERASDFGGNVAWCDVANLCSRMIFGRVLMSRILRNGTVAKTNRVILAKAARGRSCLLPQIRRSIIIV